MPILKDVFHPVVEGWFRGRFSEPTPVQARAWPLIAAGGDVLLTAPTGSGKTLAAFLACLDRLFRKAVAGTLEDRAEILYVSPLKALSNDVRRNLDQPLAELAAAAVAAGLPAPDDPHRGAHRRHPRPRAPPGGKRPPHVLVTTPESLFILLTAESSRRWLADVRTVIVDEIHAVAGDKRGAHLALSLERLDELVSAASGGRERLQRIGLSATVRPVETAARLLVGAHPARCPRSWTWASGATWTSPSRCCATSWARSAPTSSGRRSTTASPSWPGPTARPWSSSTPAASSSGSRATWPSGWASSAVAAHHSSLSRARRFDAEQRLKSGELSLVVATASLELGIDVGTVDLTCLLGSPRSIATALQRVGRSGHALARHPQGPPLPAHAGSARRVRGPGARGAAGGDRRPRPPPRAARRPRPAAGGHLRGRGAGRGRALRALPPRRALRRPDVARDFDAVVDMLAEGIATRRGRAGARLHRDAVGRRLTGRRGARLIAITSGGAIPDTASYQVVLEPDETPIGTLDEDFAIESMAGDVILLGNSSWRIRRIESGKVRVEDAGGRALHHSLLARRGARAHARALRRGLRACAQAVAERLDDPEAAARWLTDETGLDARGARPRPRLHRGRPRRAGRGPDARHRGGRALLRRGGRHADGAPRALRRPHQPRLGHGAPQAALPELQLRAAGRGHGRRRPPLAGSAAQLPARDGGRHGAPARPRRAPHPGRAPGAHVRHPLAVEREPRARPAALVRAAGRCHRICSACAPRICSSRCSPRSSPARTTWGRGPSRSPTIRW